jgi:uncharacterized membrane protein required for colicin V production
MHQAAHMNSSKYSKIIRFAVAIIAWILSGFSVAASIHVTMFDFIRNPFEAESYYMGMPSVLAFVVVLFLWIALGVMTVGWVRDKKVHWVWPVFGAIFGLLVTYNVWVFITFLIFSIPLAVHLSFFHLYYKERHLKPLLCSGITTLASASVFGVMWGLNAHAELLLSTREYKNPPEKRAPQFDIGDLGGMLVKIPSYFPTLVEYNGDPGWGENMNGRYKTPQRTQSSKIMSFGFDVRYPDMVGKATPELRKDYRERSIFNTTWIRVGVRSGEIFPGPGFMNRSTNGINDNPFGPFKYIEKEKDTQSIDGLTLLVADGVNPKTKIPYRMGEYIDDIYLHRNARGDILTYINCSNRPIDSAPCRHDFSLEPHANAWIIVSYRRGLIANWKSIQESVKNLILSFNINNKSKENLPDISGESKSKD